jgi:hypothetical protein
VGRSGWLVLAGSIPSSSEGSGWLDRLLGCLDLDRPAFWLAQDPDDAWPTELLDDLEEILQTSIPLISPSEPSWEEAGFLLMAGSPDDIPGPAIAGRLLQCLDGGGVIMAMSDAAADFGEIRLASAGGGLQQGLGWLPGGLVLPGQDSGKGEGPARGWLQSTEKRYVLRLPTGTVFALGPGSEAEVWGGTPPGIVLGPGWTHA